VVVGGGFAGLRAAGVLARPAARGACELTFISDQPYFLYRPGMSGLAVGRLRPPDITRDLHRAPWARVARLVIAPVTGIDPDRQTVTAGGNRISYDALILAIGSVPNRSDVVGLEPFGHNIWTIEEALKFWDRLRAGARRVVVATDHTSPCVFGLYEIAMIVARSGPRVELVSTEYGPGGLISPIARRALEVLAGRLGVKLHPGRRVVEVARRGVMLDDGTTIDADVALVSPPPGAHPVTRDLGPGAARTGLVLTRASLASVRWRGLFAAGAVTAQPPPLTAHVSEQMGYAAARNALVAAGVRRGPLRAFTPTIATLLHFGRWYGLVHYLRPAGAYGPPRLRFGIGGWPLGALKDPFRRLYLAARF